MSDDLATITADESKFRTYMAENIGSINANIENINKTNSQQSETLNDHTERIVKIEARPKRAMVGSTAAGGGIAAILVGVVELFKAMGRGAP